MSTIILLVDVPDHKRAALEDYIIKTIDKWSGEERITVVTNNLKDNTLSLSRVHETGNVS